MTPQTESQFLYDTLYPALTFKSGLFSLPAACSVGAAAVQRGEQS